MTMRIKWTTLGTMMIGLLTAGGTRADSWPQWRGPKRDGVWREHGIVDDLAALEIKWRAPISGGYTGPTVAGGRVFVMDRLIDPTQVERVLCFDADTGRKLWEHAYPCPYRNVSYDTGPRAAVVVEQDRAFAFGTMGDLSCLDASTGAVLWQRDLDAEYDVNMPVWGLAASPLIFENLIITQVGGEGACIVAFDTATGQEAWRSLDDPASYVAPILIEQAGRPVLVVVTGATVSGLDPRSGAVHWQVPFEPVRMVIVTATPVLYKDYLFITSFFDGSLLLKLDQETLAAREVWRRRGRNEKKTDALHSIIATPVIKDDHIYGVDSYGELRCLDLLTGDRKWESLDAVPKARWSTIHFVEHGQDTWMFNERGELIIARLSPQGYQERSRAKLIEPTTGQLNERGGVCWSHPAFAERSIFVRNDKEIVCASLAENRRDIENPTAADRRAELEDQFRKTLTGAVLSGSWQMINPPAGQPTLTPPRTDQYSITKATKLVGDQWAIHARIQYADKDVTIPVGVRVVWAGDTPVITIDNLGLPFLGTYSARVMIHRNFYSGTWFGTDYGGVMSGQIFHPQDGVDPPTVEIDGAPLKQGD